MTIWYYIVRQHYGHLITGQSKTLSVGAGLVCLALCLYWLLDVTSSSILSFQRVDTIQKIGKGLLIKEILCNTPDIFWDKPFLSVITLSNFDLESLSLKLMWIMYNITHCPKFSQKAWSVYYKLVEKILNQLQYKRLAKWADKRSCSLFLHFPAEIQQPPVVWTLGRFIWQKVF